ncbi:MAG: hypothetical protein JXB25_03695 [Deltaproteobacteria bacterium]|nr:hypothetical protein [Deltaproteobacteria bacterium]
MKKFVAAAIGVVLGTLPLNGAQACLILTETFLGTACDGQYFFLDEDYTTAYGFNLTAGGGGQLYTLITAG